MSGLYYGELLHRLSTPEGLAAGSTVRTSVEGHSGVRVCRIRARACVMDVDYSCQPG